MTYMLEKPTYEELERRVHELEKIESELKKLKEEVRESENEFKRLYEKAPIGYQSLDENGNFIIVDQAWLDTQGYTQEEVIGKSFAEFLLPDWKDHFKKNFPQFKAIGEILGVEFEMVKKNGDPILVSFTGKITRDEKGGFQQTHCIFHDITERKRQEDELRKARELSARIIDDGPVAMTLVDRHGKIVFANRLAERLFGLDKSDIEALEYNSPEWLIVDIDGSPFPDERLPFRQVMSTGQAVYNVQHAITRPNAARKILSINGAPLHDEQGRIDRVVFAILDITERKKAEEELRRRENQLQRIFEILPVGLWFADKNGTLLRGNPKGIEIWGAEPKVPLSEYGVFKGWRLPSRELIEADQWALAKTIRNGETIVDELLEIESFDGKRKTILNYTAPVLDVDGRVDGGIIANLDISDRIALENQLHQAQKMESIGRLAGGVAHDFNNMLGAILGYTELAMEQVELDNPLHSNLEKIQGAAQRSADLTRQLLAFARKQTVSPKVIHLNDTIESVLKLLQRLIGEDIDLAWQPGKGVWPVKIDPTQVDQMLTNLCVNARDAIVDTGKVTIETGTASFDKEYCAHHGGFVVGDYVLLAVSDTGCGMDEETQSHLFEPFFTTKEMGKGTGLGLATVYGVVKQNNGFINVYSEPGQGTTFKIYLPRHLAKTAPLPEKEPDKPGQQGSGTVLLVEDEPTILEMTTGMLERLGYTVLAAGTPGEAIRLAQEHPGRIDLLLTDVVMPEMNGRDLAKNLLSIYPDIRRLFMSGYTANVIAHHGVLDEGVHFIQKPFTRNDLAAKIRAALD